MIAWNVPNEELARWCAEVIRRYPQEDVYVWWRRLQENARGRFPVLAGPVRARP